MRITFILTIALLISMSANAQVKVGNNPTIINASAALEIESTTKGFLLPRMTSTERSAISSPATGLLIFNTTTSSIEVNVGTPSLPSWQMATLPAGTSGQTLRHNGTNWIANSNLFNNGTNVGIGTSTPASTIDIQGSLGYKVNTITAATTLSQIHNVVLCNTGPYTVTLPAASSNAGKVYYIKNIDADGDDITIDGNASETIDGALTFLLDPYKHATRIVSDGANWHVLEEAGQIINPSSFNQFNCDGSIFTWSDVTNSTTGKTWMDRNLGAKQVATSSTDANSYGDLYQWGRLKDGHQCRNSITTSTLSKNDVPIHAKLIPNNSNWRSTSNFNLWQGINGINNPCPSGYRLPTETELNNERLTWSNQDHQGAIASVLKLPAAGKRESDGVLYVAYYTGGYWSSTVSSGNTRYLSFYVGTNSASMRNDPPSFAYSVRCIKD